MSAKDNNDGDDDDDNNHSKGGQEEIHSSWTIYLRQEDKFNQRSVC